MASAAHIQAHSIGNSPFPELRALLVAMRALTGCAARPIATAVDTRPSS